MDLFLFPTFMLSQGYIIAVEKRPAHNLRPHNLFSHTQSLFSGTTILLFTCFSVFVLYSLCH